MSDNTQHTFGPWLRACVRDAALQLAAERLATAACTPEQGDGALLVFSMARACCETLGAADCDPIKAWTTLAANLAENGLPASKKHAQIQEGSRRDRRAKVWGPLLRMADLHAQHKLTPGCRVAVGLALSQGLASGVALSKKVADQLSGMAGACVRGSGHEYAAEWVAFSEANLLDAAELKSVVNSGAPEQIRSLAATLLRALDGLPAVPLPASIRSDAPGAVAGGIAAGTTADEANQQPFMPEPSGDDEPHGKRKKRSQSTQPRLKQVASVKGVSKDASFARTAHVFGVPDAWDRYAPHRLSPVTQAIGQALAPARQGLTRSLAVLAIMAMVVSHDHRPAARLRIGLRDGEVPDLYYCPKYRCVFASRRLLLRLKTDDGTPDLIPLFVPGDAADEIARLLHAQPDARDLVDLFGIQNLDEWLRQTEAWLSGLGDPAHKSTSGRVSHALGLMYRLVGASEVEAALLTLNLALAPDGALHYIAISAERAYELACRVFDFLKLQRPAPPPAGMRIGSRDVPTFDEMREDWADLSQKACDGLQRMSTAGALDDLLSAFTQVMVAARRAYESLTGARHENLGMPRVADLLGSDQEGYTDDKRTQPSSARLLTMTPDLRHVISVVCEARALLLARLRALGVPEEQIPGELKVLLPWTPFFFRLKRGGKRNKRLLTLRVLDGKTLEKHKRPWKGASNMGRHFWASAAGRSDVDWAEQVTCGHGRGLAHVGSPCLGIPVAVLQDGVSSLVRSTLDALALPAFGGGLSPPVPQIDPVFDFRFIDARDRGARFVGSAPGDMPAHHCDSHSTMALPVARAMRTHVGEDDHQANGATVLLALAAIDGLTYSQDIRSVWGQLRQNQGTPAAAFITVQRTGGQSFELKLLPATRTALDLAGPLPAWDVAERALRTWLVARWPSIRWPTRPGGVLAAVCWIAARLVRLCQLPILVQAYRPEVNAACYDAVSNLRLKTGGAPVVLGGAELRPLLRPITRRARSTGKTVLQQMLRQHGGIAMSKLRKGGEERRAKVLHAWFERSFPVHSLTPVALMVLRWVLAECDRWNPVRPHRDQPSTIYKYLQRLLAALDLLPEGTDPAAFGAAEWRQFGTAMLDTSDVVLEADLAKAFRWRRVALGRLVSVLQTLPQYGLARHAVSGPDVPAGVVPRAVSAARVMVRPADLETAVVALHTVYDDDFVQALAAEARLRLAFDLRARADEINALELSDLAADGSFASIDTVGFTHLKTTLSMRLARLSPRTAEVMLQLRAALRALGKPPRLFFSEVNGQEDLRHGYRQQVVVDAVMRGVLSHPGFDPHALRGNGFMDGLCPNHTDHVIAMLAGPFELVHARAIVDGLAGASPAHVAVQLNTTGHASDGVAVADYMTAWPWWYAAGMRVTLTDVPLTPALAARIPGCSKSGLATWRRRAKHRGTVDEWCWSVRRHVPGWTWRPACTAEVPTAPPARAPAVAAKPTTLANPLVSLPFAKQVHYLVLRQLGWEDVGARGDARIGDRAGDALEPLLLLLPVHAEVHDPGNPDPSDRPRDSAARLLEVPPGQALFKHLLVAPSVASQLLLQMLRGAAPTCSKAHVDEALRALPQALGLELAFGPGEPGTTFKQIFKASRRVRVTGLTRAPKPAPRVRVIEALPSPINQCTAAEFTALARLILESIHQLKQGV